MTGKSNDFGRESMKNRKKKDNLTPQEVFGTTSSEEEKKKGVPVGMIAGKTASTVTKMGLLRKMLLMVAAGLCVLMGGTYLGTLFITGSSGFTVRASRSGDQSRVISLSETYGFTNGTVLLKGPVNEAMDNITYTDLPLDNLESGDGDHSGENYIAYTYYLKNSGTETLDYSYSLIYPKATLGIEKAVRITLLQNGNATTYAAPADGGGVEAYPEQTTNFAGDGIVEEDVRKNLAPGEIDRYTIVVWLEGEDPECVDAVRKGTMSLEMDFDVIE